MMHAIIQEVLRDQSGVNENDILTDDNQVQRNVPEEEQNKAGCINVSFPFFCRSDSLSSNSIITLSSVSSDEASSSSPHASTYANEASVVESNSSHTVGNTGTSATIANTNDSITPSATFSPASVCPFEAICKEIPNTPKDIKTPPEIKPLKEKPTCLICFEALKPRKRFVHKLRFQCDHGNGIHKKCMNQWIQAQLGRGREPVCPLCRKKVFLTFFIAFPSKNKDIF